MDCLIRGARGERSSLLSTVYSVDIHDIDVVNRHSIVTAGWPRKYSSGTLSLHKSNLSRTKMTPLCETYTAVHPGGLLSLAWGLNMILHCVAKTKRCFPPWSWRELFGCCFQTLLLS